LAVTPTAHAPMTGTPGSLGVSKLAVTPSTATPPTTNTPSTPGVSKLVVAPTTGTPNTTTLSLNSVTPSSVTPVSDLKNSLIGVSKDAVTPPPAGTPPSTGTPGTGYTPVPGASRPATDFFNDDKVKGLVQGIASYSLTMQQQMDGAAASFSAQDFLVKADPTNGDVAAYNNTATQFLNEVSHDQNSIETLVAGFKNAQDGANGLWTQLKDYATSRGLNYATDIEPFMANAPEGSVLQAAVHGAATSQANLMYQAINYTNKLTVQANNFLQGFDLVKKNAKLNDINNLLTILGGNAFRTGYAYLAVSRAFSPYLAVQDLAKSWGSFNSNNYFHLDAWAVTVANDFWKQTADSSSTPLLKNLVDTTPLATMDQITGAVEGDLGNAYNAAFGPNGAIGQLYTKVQQTAAELNPPPPDDDGGWYIPSV
jgi:hypothetical protein